MKIIEHTVISLSILALVGCASSGSSSLPADYCPQAYQPSTAHLLAGLSDLAYEEDRGKVKAKLEQHGFTLDEYDIRHEDLSVEGFIAQDNEKVIVAFAGTKDLEDWKNNAKTWSEPIDDPSCGKQIRFHKGFYETSKEVLKQNNAGLIAHLVELQKQGKKVYVTGHSLGGAMASITAYYLKTSETPIELAGVYTYGQPYTGDDDFQGCYDEKLKEQTFRFVTDKDVIPKMRFDSSYRHIGVFLFFDENGGLLLSKPSSYEGDFVSLAKSDLGDSHSMSSYLTFLEKNKAVNPFACQ